MAELDPEICAKVQALSADGDALANAADYEAAIGKYNEAWLIIPEPKADWEGSTWLLAAIGDAAFLGGYMKSARDAFEFAMHCPSAIGNPFLHMRLGQVVFEQGNFDRAADELIRAYAIAGAEIFASEDPKYLAFLSARANLDS